MVGTSTGTPQFEKDVKVLFAGNGTAKSTDNDGSKEAESVSPKKIDIAVALYDFIG